MSWREALSRELVEECSSFGGCKTWHAGTGSSCNVGGGG
jgi:hypothetical protein